MDFLYRMFVQPIKNALAEKLSPSVVALSIALGFVGGIFPVPFTTTIVCALLWNFVRPVNKIITQTVNAMCTPVQLVFIPFFLAVGKMTSPFSLGQPDIAVSDMIAQVRESPIAGFQTFASVFLVAIIGWAILFIPFLAVTYFALLAVLRKVMHPHPRPHQP